MKYTKYTIETTTKDAEMISALLMDYDINDVQIENNVQLTDDELNQIYADFFKELPPDDGSCKLSFFIEFDENGVNRANTEKKIKELKAYLNESVEMFNLDPIKFFEDELESADWENNWKKYFKPFQVEDILIVPTWIDVNNISEILTEVPGYVSADGGASTDDNAISKVSNEDDGVFGTTNVVASETCSKETTNNEASEICSKETMSVDVGVTYQGQAIVTPNIIIRIDPGMAFGTGTHETTRLCLRGLRKYMKKGDKVLDLGCGSGILGIGAIKMGATSIVSVDIDAQAVEVAKENFEINDVASGVSKFYVGDVVTNEELKSNLGSGYDVVVVNILAEVINMMLPTLDTYLKDDGILIMSGILDSREQLIKDAISKNPNLTYLETTHDGEWVRISAKRI